MEFPGIYRYKNNPEVIVLLFFETSDTIAWGVILSTGDSNPFFIWPGNHYSLGNHRSFYIPLLEKIL